VCFSVFEHLHDYRRGLAEVARVLRPGGHFLLGMPAVNVMMEAGFRAIGFKGIEDHHVTTPASVAKAFDAAGLRVAKTAHFVFPVPGVTIYYNWLLEKRA
jgi:SAM-dependent methyltransferase